MGLDFFVYIYYTILLMLISSLFPTPHKECPVEVNVRIDSIGRATCVMDAKQVAPDFDDSATRAFLLTPASRKMILAVAVSPAKESTSTTRAVDFEGNLIHIRPRHLDGNGVATFSPFTHGNFVVMMEKRGPTHARVLIRKIGVRRQGNSSWIVVSNHFDGELEFASADADAVADQLAAVGSHGADPGDHLRKFAAAVATMWAEVSN